MSLERLAVECHGRVRKAFRTGTHRVIAPALTIERLRPALTAMGITRLANVTGLDSIGIPVAAAYRPNSRSISVTNGKGVDWSAAGASALMEAAESYHAERMALPLKLASYAEFAARHDVMDLDAAPWRANSIYHRHLPLLWIEGHDLMQDERIWIPYELVHTNYSLPLPQGSGCFVMSSNGLASGNHLLEAISHGICEIVERDATTLWELRGDQARRSTRVELAGIDDPASCEVLAKYRAAGIDVAVFETTSDIGLPAFLCAISVPDQSTLSLSPTAFGMGCHPTREIALLRALTEAAQSRLTMIAGSRDDIFSEDYEFCQSAHCSPGFLHANEDGAPVRRMCHVPSWETESFDEDVALELERLRTAGISRVIVVDLTRPDLNVPVVRVVIPGLEYSASAANYALGARARARLDAAQ